MKDFVILDIETTGLSRQYHKITEIAAVKISGNKITDKYETLINPERPIPQFITRLTGINNTLVRNAPTIKNALPKFLSFLKDGIIVGHNVSFDYGFLNRNSKLHLGRIIENNTLCTRRLANRLVPNLKSKSLSSLCEKFRINNKRAHRAMSDVLATKDLFMIFLKMLKEMGITEQEKIIRFQKSKIKRNLKE